jgi:hypothetical protein
MRALTSRSALEWLSSGERERLRHAADTLVLAGSCDGESRAALAAARAVLVSIRHDRIAPWIEQLADDLEDAGPAPVRLFAMPAHPADRPAAAQTQGTAWR